MSEPEQYLSKWFKGAPLSEIRRENIKLFFCWSFLNKSGYGMLDDQELEDYADQLEKVLERELPPGKGNAIALRLTLDKVQMLFRPLVWYLVSPPGLEVELRNAEINRDEEEPVDGQVGVIAIEIMPISFRLTLAALSREEMTNQILKIVQSHGWTNFVLVSHSYGSVVATHLLRDPKTSSMIDAQLLIDPVSILLHLPDVAFNFTCRKPGRANEHQLYYFASMDTGVSHTLARGFFWQENILWKHEVQDRRLTVVLCGRDIIVNTEAVGRYLASDETQASKDSSWKTQEWKGDGLDLIWFEDLDHAQVFETRHRYARLVEVIRHYTSTPTKPK
ncbi:MAG: hypothetical protein LQ346_007242 [Caloplaca aetnensis]|nr:MAG: hypothetical protein LQ346_007242 [Caloplaca aetnensis]